MAEFFSNNWKDIIEVIFSLIIGFFSGKKYENYTNKKIKQIAKINGDNNNISQKGE